MEKIKISYFKPEKEDIIQTNDGYRFALSVESREEAGVILYKGQEAFRFPFSKEGKQGSLFGIALQGKEFDFDKYNYYVGSRILTDAKARLVGGLDKFGDASQKPRTTYGLFPAPDYDWEGDSMPEIPWKDSIIYGLNVRGFTMHRSSQVKNKGTYEGIIEKIPYFKKLGITAIELMPSYEFDECMYPEQNPAPSVDPAGGSASFMQVRTNCWGFQKGFYYAPKASYAAGRADISFKNMVKALHKNGIELFMQFFFSEDTRQVSIPEILKFWVREYHVDGFRICGYHLPLEMIAGEPFLKTTKIRCPYFELDNVYGKNPPFYKNIAFDDQDYRNEMRRFLKGDENLIDQLFFYHRNNPEKHAVVNYIADYDGFSLHDLYAYEQKHNEANGENNSDGTDRNYSWNCGMEGKTRKKAILDRRYMQMKNALSLVFLSQGVPFLFSGDEFANTRYGNNNAYCQDNETGWIKWNKNLYAEDLCNYVIRLIRLRKGHSIIHMEREFQIMDTLGCGIPDLSYHGSEAWRPDVSYNSRTAGIMLCGCYAGEKTCFYLAVNMHWLPHRLALPKLPKGQRWKLLLSSAEPAPEEALGDYCFETNIMVPGRCFDVYISEAEPSAGKSISKGKKT